MLSVERFKDEEYLISKLNLEERNPKEETLYKCNGIIDLLEKIDNPEKIHLISIHKDHFNFKDNFDISIFKCKNFTNLIKLELTDLNINNISSFSTCKFPQLETLLLSANHINDNCIQVLENLDLPKINFISFFSNDIHSIKIFEKIKRFNTLKKFYIGQNIFDKEEEIDYLKKGGKIELNNNLEELGISSIFNMSTNEYIKNFELENIKIFYASGNELNSLEIFEKIKFKKLEEIWINGKIVDGKKSQYLEDISVIEHLKNNKELRVISLSNYIFKNINDIEKYIKLFPKLEILLLINCGISENDINKLPFDIRKKIKY